MNMSYHASFFSITNTMILTSFDSFKVKWLNSQFSFSYMNVGTLVHKYESMDMNNDNMEEETTLYQI